MAGVTGGLGRGLDALLGGAREGEEKKHSSVDVRQIDIESIEPNPNQPRKEFEAEALKDLSDSIKIKGVLQPVLVRPVTGRKDKFELVAGERRLRASKLAGLSNIPALVKEMTDLESMAVALIENLQREDLNPIEEAKGYQELVSKFKLGQEQLAAQVGKSRSALSNAMRLLALPLSMQEAIGAGKISAGHGRTLVGVANEEVREDLFKSILSRALSVRQTEAAATYFKEHGELPQKAVETASHGKSKKNKPKKEDENLERLKEKLETALKTKISFCGSSRKGKLTINYSSYEELEHLISIFELQP